MGRTHKFRAHRSRTHGRGKKGGRGHGLRGGRGNAGLHKHRYITLIKYMPGHFGRHGFKRPQKVVGTLLTTNVCDIEELLDNPVKMGVLQDVGIIAKEDDAVVIDLTKRLSREERNEIGFDFEFDKLLGKGRISTSCKIVVEAASPGAIRKVEEAGGQVVISGTSE